MHQHGKDNFRENMHTSSGNMGPLAIVMVGLPARGKTYIAKKLTRYLNWVGYDTKVFNVGEYRRNKVSQSQSQAEFFDPHNEEAVNLRDQLAKEALYDMCDWLKGGGEIAVYDATNSCRSRRNMICQYIQKLENIKVFFIESICFDRSIIEANIKEVKVSSPDYQNTDRDEAIEDFKRRIQHYESQYETIDEDCEGHLSFIKIFNQGERYLVNRVVGHIESRVVYYLMNIHVLPRTIYITRHGEAELNISGKIGNDGDLTSIGKAFAKNLGDFVKNETKDNTQFRVWTSLMTQTVETGKYINGIIEHWKALNEIDAGICEGMTYEEVRINFPNVYKQRELDKFHYRYPSGESYQDLVVRLEPVILQLERQKDIMVIASQAVCRCLLAYFLDKDLDELPYIDVPLHTVFKLTPIAYGCREEKICIPPEPSVNTYRPRPQEVLPLTRQERKARRRQISECNQSDCCGRSRPASVSTCGTDG